jgi:hypothetical protein
MKRFLFFSFLIAVLTVFVAAGCKKKDAEEAGLAEEGGDEVVLEKPLEVGEEGG